MNLVNSKDIVADRVRDIQAQAAGARRPRNPRQPRSTWRGAAAWAAARFLARPQQTIKVVEGL